MSPGTGTLTAITVSQFAAMLSATTPRLGRTRLIALDGRSGSGKTWLAGLLAEQLAAPVIHMDDLYAGWDGLPGSVRALADWIAGPLASRRPARWRRFDWDAMRYAEWHATEPAGTVVLEGCGSVRAALAAAYAARVWVDAPAATRQSRLETRHDWAMYQPHVRRWAAMEERLYRAEQTRRHCDFIVENATDGESRFTVHLQANDLSTSNASDTSEGLS